MWHHGELNSDATVVVVVVDVLESVTLLFIIDKFSPRIIAITHPSVKTFDILIKYISYFPFYICHKFTFGQLHMFWYY